MNIKPITQGTGAPAGSEVDLGRSASSDRMARAKAVANGQQPQEARRDTQVERAEQSIKKIKMRTQRSVFRDLPPEQFEASTEIPPESNIPDTIDTSVVSEETKPLSPQFAALAKAKRALQVKEREIEAREQKLSQGQGVSTDHIAIDRLKSDPLGVLREAGVTNDQLTEALLSHQEQTSPQYTRLEAEMKALKEGLDNQNKTQTQRDEAQKVQALDQMEREATKLVAQGDDFEMVRETGSIKDVRRLIEKTFDTTGEILDVEEALALIENELIEESLKIARIKKVQSRLTPAQIQQQQPQKVNQSGVRVMRTLTNRDGASAPFSARERAMAAFHGRKL